MFKKRARYYTLLTIISSLITAFVTAGEQIPTFQLKNKSPQTLALVIHAKDATTAKPINTKKINDKSNEPKTDVREGMHVPSQPMLVLPWHDITYYNLRNIEALDIYYNRENTLWVIQYKFNNINDKSTFYVKHCDPVTQGGWFGYGILGCGTDLSAQEGKIDKATGKGKTTDGHSLEYNVTYDDIKETGRGEAGTGRTSPDGTFTGLPTINFADAKKNYSLLPIHN